MQRRFNPREAHLRAFDFTCRALVAAKGDATYAENLARQRWPHEGVAPLLKAAVGASTRDSDWTSASLAFLESLDETSVIGRLRGVRAVPFQREALATVTGAGGGFVQEGRAMPVSKAQFANLSLPRHTAGSLVLASADFAASGADGALRTELEIAVRKGVDARLLGTDAADAAGPAGLLADAVAVASTGTTVAQIAADLRGMVDVMRDAGVSLTSAHWIVSHSARALLHLLKISDPDGRLAGLPVVPTDQAVVVLVAADRLAVARGDNVELRASQEGVIEMDDAPSGDVGAPTASTVVPLFQTGSVALSAAFHVSWLLLPGAVSTAGNAAAVQLTGASYV